MKCFHAIAVLLAATIATAADLWPIYQPACSSNGIPDKQCQCILDEVSRAHGEKAARYVGLDMILRYDEAAELLDEIGEDKAFAASDTFDVAQNTSCSSGRLERLEGTRQGSGAAASIGVSAVEDAVGGTVVSDRQYQKIDAFASSAPVIDLRSENGDVIADVTGSFRSEMLRGRSDANLRDYIGFYEVVNAQGGIDTTGDASANLSPGDPDYAAEVQKRMLPTKLYFQKNSANEQVLGEIRFRNKLYAPVIRFKTAADAGGGMPNLADLSSLQDLMRAVQTPQHLYFIFPQANPEGANHIVKRDENSIGFAAKPGQVEDDVIFEFRLVN